jgi:hypothetical protein
MGATVERNRSRKQEARAAVGSRVVAGGAAPPCCFSLAAAQLLILNININNSSWSPP